MSEEKDKSKEESKKEELKLPEANFAQIARQNHPTVGARLHNHSQLVFLHGAWKRHYSLKEFVTSLKT